LIRQFIEKDCNVPVRDAQGDARKRLADRAARMFLAETRNVAATQLRVRSSG
jgi:hypothetical protein